MSDNLLPCIAGFFSTMWRFFTELEFPGTGFSFAELGIALILIGVAFGILGTLVNGRISSGDVKSIKNYGKPNKARGGK